MLRYSYKQTPVLQNFLPNILLILAIVGFFVLILRRLPQAKVEVDASTSSEDWDNKNALFAKFKFFLKKVWTTILEAKGLKPEHKSGFRVRKIWNSQPKKQSSEVLIPPVMGPKVIQGMVKDESYYLEKIKSAPKEIENFVGLAKFYVDQKQFDNAEKVYEYLTRLEPGNAGYYAKLGFCYYQLENYTLAVGSYQKSIALDSTQPSRYYNLGLAYEALQNWKSSIRAFEEALSIDPENDKYKLAISRIKALRKTSKIFQDK